MQGVIDFADGLLGGAILVALAITVAGPAFALLVLDSAERRADAAAGRRCLGVMAGAAAALVLFQGAALAIRTTVLLGDAGGVRFPEIAGATWFRAGVARAAAAAVVAGAAWLVRRRRGPGHWGLLAALVGLVLAAGAFLVHAVGRLEDRGALMIVTVLHQAAAGAWVGGLVHLAAHARLGTRDATARERWPVVVARFARLAIASVAGVLLTSVPLGWTYVGSLDALVGTAYGSLVLTKAGLMVVALGLGAVNFRSARGAAAADRGGPLRTRVPYLVEAETIVLAILLFVAATLGAQPPATDVVSERATVSEVIEVFRPKWPALRTPSLEAKRRSESDPFAVVGGERTPTAYQWSNFTHNVAGIVVAGMAVLALLASIGGVPLARHWPAGLVLLAVFIFLRSSASDGAWPFGSAPFWLGDAEGFQHRLGAFLALVLGIMEWRARVRPRPGSILPYVFPVLALAGGVLLLTHSHAAFELKSNYLIQVTHSTMGALAVLIACGRWLELRLAPPAGRTAGALAHTAMLLVALILVFYREANVAVPLE